jgi:energy-coupling factor transporter ATP-binding protein EcfA2
MTHPEPLMRLDNIRMTYGSVQALSGVDLHVNEGEIPALLGDNGAGKSTLIKILSGVVQPDAGSITLRGEPVKFSAGPRTCTRTVYVIWDTVPDTSDMTRGVHHRPLAEAQRLVRGGRLRYFLLIAAGSHQGIMALFGGGGSATSAVVAWVKSACTQVPAAGYLTYAASGRSRGSAASVPPAQGGHFTILPGVWVTPRYTQSMTDMTTIKVSVATRDRLRRLADEDHLTLDAELARTLDKVEEARFWAGVRADYARLQADPQKWGDYVSELAEWDHTAGDGLGHE